LFLGSTPIGAPLVGWIAETYSTRAALVVGGIVTLAACAYAYSRLPAQMVDSSHSGGERVARELILEESR
jgi:predicted MFS family arabinose efflux permease